MSLTWKNLAGIHQDDSQVYAMLNINMTCVTFVYFRHYRQAYSLLGELKSSDINILEIKVVAGFVNYKVCVFRIQKFKCKGH